MPVSRTRNWKGRDRTIKWYRARLNRHLRKVNAARLRQQASVQETHGELIMLREVR